jgi:predicted dehydrogenase
MATKTVRIGVIGGGRVGEGFLRDLKREKEVAVTGVVTSTAARREELAARYGVRCYPDVDALMGSSDKPEIVFVVNANEDHAAATVRSLQAGCHVYCEKPMAATLSDCNSMVEAERRSGCHLQIGFEYMHGTMTSRLLGLIRSGYFGDLLWASVLDSRGHWWSNDPDAPASDIWKLDRMRGGGIIFHCGIHQLDMIRCYLGGIREITAYKPPRNAFPFYPPDVPSNVTLMLTAESGAVCNFQVFHDRAPCYYRSNPSFSPDWRTVPGHEFDVSLVGTEASCLMRIYGEELHLFRFDHAAKDTRFDRTEKFGPQHPSLSHHDMHGLMMRFIRNIAEGRGAVDPAAEALDTMRLAFASEDAIVKGGTVRVADYR